MSGGVVGPLNLSGYKPYNNAALSNTSATVKSVPGIVGGWFIDNPNSSMTYVQFYDTTSAVTVGTTLPDFFLGIPANGAANVHLPIKFTKGIKIAATTTRTGASAPASSLGVSLFVK